MAWLYKTNCEREEVFPKNGTDFSLGELQSFVGGYIEVLHMNDDLIMVINEDGKLCCDYNRIASVIAFKKGAISRVDYICGDALVCETKEVK